MLLNEQEKRFLYMEKKVEQKLWSAAINRTLENTVIETTELHGSVMSGGDHSSTLEIGFKMEIEMFSHF